MESASEKNAKMHATRGLAGRFDEDRASRERVVIRIELKREVPKEKQRRARGEARGERAVDDTDERGEEARARRDERRAREERQERDREREKGKEGECDTGEETRARERAG